MRVREEGEMREFDRGLTSAASARALFLLRDRALERFLVGKEGIASPGPGRVGVIYAHPGWNRKPKTWVRDFFWAWAFFCLPSFKDVSILTVESTSLPMATDFDPSSV